jgi:5-methylcytosine-specific restriction endonuclease McrA
MNFKALSNAQLEGEFGKTVAEDRARMAYAVALLVEIKEREIHLRGGYENLFDYCSRKWKLCKSTSSRWTRAARAAVMGKDIVARIRDGRLGLSVAAKLADCPDLLERADGITLDQADRLLAELHPEKVKRDILPPAPLDAPALALSRQTIQEVDADQGKDKSRTKRRLHADLSERTLALCHRMLELLPGKGLDEIMGLALDAYLDQHDTLRRAAKRKDKKEPSTKPKEPKKESADKKQPRRTVSPRSVDAAKKQPRRPTSLRALKDEVAARANGQCEFVSRDGVRCTARTHCQHDHIMPLSLGGEDTLENSRLLCDAHHRMLSKASFPDFWAALGSRGSARNQPESCAEPSPRRAEGEGSARNQPESCA